MISHIVSNNSMTKSVGFALNNNENFNLIVGCMSSEINLFQELQSMCSEKDYSEIKNKQKLKHLIKPIKNILGEYLVLRSVNGFESTYIYAPKQHHILDVHQDSDEYGNGITILVYPRVDETISSGRLLIMNESFDDINYLKNICEMINLNVSEAVASYETKFDHINYRDENVLCINNKMTSDGKYPFVSFDGNMLHQVEEINGTGVREALFLFVDGIFKDIN